MLAFLGAKLYPLTAQYVERTKAAIRHDIIQMAFVFLVICRVGRAWKCRKTWEVMDLTLAEQIPRRSATPTAGMNRTLIRLTDWRVPIVCKLFENPI